MRVHKEVSKGMQNNNFTSVVIVIVLKLHDALSIGY